MLTMFVDWHEGVRIASVIWRVVLIEGLYWPPGNDTRCEFAVGMKIFKFFSGEGTLAVYNVRKKKLQIQSELMDSDLTACRIIKVTTVEVSFSISISIVGRKQSRVQHDDRCSVFLQLERMRQYVRSISRVSNAWRHSTTCHWSPIVKTGKCGSFVRKNWLLQKTPRSV